MVVCDPEGKEKPIIGPDLTKVQKLKELGKPTTIKEVRLLLGLVTQLSRFSLDYAQNTLRSVT